jgi:hypothetical protein
MNMNQLQQQQFEDMMEDSVFESVTVLFYENDKGITKYKLVGKYGSKSSFKGFAYLVTQKNLIREFKSLDSCKKLLDPIESFIVQDELYFSASNGLG